VDFLEDFKSKIDIVRVVGEYVRLKRVGATGRYLGLCPFHQEKTPSFNVNQTRQFYKCFGCGVGGDALKFVQEIEGLTFPEALKLLAERNGITLPRRTEFSDAESKLRSALMEMHEIAAQVFHANLKGAAGGAARDYLARRGIAPELIDTFQLGFSDSSGQTLVRRFAERYTPEQMEKSSLVTRRDDGSGFYDYFRGRLMFPIHNESGKAIAFGGRSMRDEDQPKYLNSRETPIYRKTSVLYNLHRAREAMRKADRAVLVEGYMDVIGVYSAGVREVVASCGTALTPAQVGVIHRHADTVVVNFDPDNAGANAAEKAIQVFLDEGVRVRVVSLEGGLDPDEYVKAHGTETYLEKLETASGYFHWLADRARLKFDMRSGEGRVDAFKFLLPTVQKIHNPLERAAIAEDVASYLGVDKSAVLEQFKRSGQERKPAAARAPAPKLSPIPPVEQILVGLLIHSDQVREQYLDRLTSQMTERMVTREIVEALRLVAGPGERFEFSALEGRLSPRSQALLHDALMADETNREEERYLEDAEACLRRLEADIKKLRIAELRAQIKSSELDGRMEDANRLVMELMQLERKPI
jgi:DNA primase